MNEEAQECTFCNIVANVLSCYKIHEDDNSLVFLDKYPVFHGHCLLITKTHIKNFYELPVDLIEHLFKNAQLIGKAVEIATKSQGSFIAINNTVSQSVAHLHIHIVPRKYKD